MKARIFNIVILCNRSVRQVHNAYYVDIALPDSRIDDDNRKSKICNPRNIIGHFTGHFNHLINCYGI